MKKESAMNRFERHSNGCFAVGTLVHTKEGFQPIEKIQVGDYVLSRLENGEGGVEYKRVLNTFVFEQKEVWYVEYYSKIIREKNVVKEYSEEVLIVTPNHPFWVCDILPSYRDVVKADGLPKWMSVEQLEPGMVLQLANGDLLEVATTALIRQTAQPDIGWHTGQTFGGDDDYGHIIDFGVCPPDIESTIGGEGEPNDIDYSLSTEYGGVFPPPFFAEVYNIEVEDFHTYFVGKAGVLVGDANTVD